MQRGYAAPGLILKKADLPPKTGPDNERVKVNILTRSFLAGY